MKIPITSLPRFGLTIQKITPQLTKIPTNIKKTWSLPIPGKVDESECIFLMAVGKKMVKNMEAATTIEPWMILKSRLVSVNFGSSSPMTINCGIKNS